MARAPLCAKGCKVGPDPSTNSVIVYRARTATASAHSENDSVLTDLPRQHFHGSPVLILKRLTHLVNCKEASRLLSQAQDKPLSAWDRVRLRLHLYACAACRRVKEQMGFLRQAMIHYRR
jgi:hypothetical protein